MWIYESKLHDDCQFYTSSNLQTSVKLTATMQYCFLCRHCLYLQMLYLFYRTHFPINISNFKQYTHIYMCMCMCELPWLIFLVILASYNIHTNTDIYEKRYITICALSLGNWFEIFPVFRFFFLQRLWKHWITVKKEVNIYRDVWACCMFHSVLDLFVLLHLFSAGNEEHDCHICVFQLQQNTDAAIMHKMIKEIKW